MYTDVVAILQYLFFTGMLLGHGFFISPHVYLEAKANVYTTVVREKNSYLTELENKFSSLLKDHIFSFTGHRTTVSKVRSP